MFSVLHRDLKKELLIQGPLKGVELLLVLRILMSRPIEESVNDGHLPLKESGEGVEEGLEEVGTR